MYIYIIQIFYVIVISTDPLAILGWLIYARNCALRFYLYADCGFSITEHLDSGLILEHWSQIFQTLYVLNDSFM